MWKRLCNALDKPELMEAPQFKSNAARAEYLAEVPPSLKEHPRAKMRRPWLRFSETPGALFRASELGEYDQKILAKYGMTSEEIETCQRGWSQKFKQ